MHATWIVAHVGVAMDRWSEQSSYMLWQTLNERLAVVPAGFDIVTCVRLGSIFTADEASEGVSVRPEFVPLVRSNKQESACEARGDDCVSAS